MSGQRHTAGHGFAVVISWP
ncbi:snorna binding protein [Moniliophthora roreri]|nr:snorna binding protein [Moniliophthora roreri]